MRKIKVRTYEAGRPPSGAVQTPTVLDTVRHHTLLETSISSPPAAKITSIDKTHAEVHMAHTFPDLLREVLSESFIHTVRMLPILIVAFGVVETVSHRAEANRLKRSMAHPLLGPIAAAALGLLPQCGFSVATTSLYIEGLIPTGSLLASYIATSDEAIPILMANPDTFSWVIPLLGTKLVWGAIAGIAVNYGMRKAAVSHGAHARSGTAYRSRDDAPHRTHTHTCVGTKGTVKEIIPHAISRALRIAAMVFVLSSLFDTAGHLFSERLAEAAASGRGIVRPLSASFLGLIPSCATSVVLAEGFGSGLVSFPALVSGLTANAGVGLLVLIKESRSRSQTLGVVVLLVLSALISGSLASIAAPF
ncbi:MAG TPA: arsenic efflux protein [Firmicutes bacterium]|nr:arsenic efflux protein [Candidatus Fermentithermobacillaceae bacterium]